MNAINHSTEIMKKLNASFEFTASTAQMHNNMILVLADCLAEALAKIDDLEEQIKEVKHKDNL